MRIDSFNKMESIVKSNPDISWDNWCVVIETEDDGYYTKNGVFKNEAWKTQYRFEMVDYGVWEIPDRFLTHVQV